MCTSYVLRSADNIRPTTSAGFMSPRTLTGVNVTPRKHWFRACSPPRPLLTAVIYSGCWDAVLPVLRSEHLF